MTDHRFAPPCITPDSPVRTATVLLVEDEAPLLVLVQGILERAGFVVLPAATGREALAVWEARGLEIDLLLTDMMLPGGLMGCELAAQMQENKSDLKVILTSGHCLDLLVNQTGPLREGVNFLGKPYRPQTLVQTLRTCLASAA